MVKQPTKQAFTIAEDAIVTIKNMKKINPQRVGDELERIRLAHGGDLRPGDVVEAARDPKHALHSFFEWDDQKAAEHYRVAQARGIIRLVRVENENTDSGSIRAFLSVTSENGRAYRPVAEIMASSDLRDRVLAQALKDLEAWKLRYRELSLAFEFIDGAVEVIKSRRGKKGPEPRPRA